MSAPIALRTRRSAYDTRVQMMSFTDGEAACTSVNLPADVAASSPKSKQRESAKEAETLLTESSLPTPPATPKRKRSSLAEKTNDTDPAKGAAPRKSTPTRLRPKLLEPHPEPTQWRETYDIIKTQREGIVAAVDLMGCDAITGMKEEHAIPDRDRRLASLISLMLSSQTKDPVTHEATMNLKRNLQGGLCLEGILAASDAELQASICKVGFWRRKTEYIRKTAEILRDQFDGDVPKTIDDLLILPGVGPKMGFLCLQAAWGIHTGIGVDTHVHRITNRLGWHRKTPKDPEETRVNLESWLPQELHNHINVMLVGFGQTICLPINPRCDLCHLGQMEDSPCPSRRKVLLKQAQAKKEEGETPLGELEPVAETVLELQDMRNKPLVAIKLETAEPVLTTFSAQDDQQSTTLPKESPYFPASSAW